MADKSKGETPAEGETPEDEQTEEENEEESTDTESEDGETPSEEDETDLKAALEKAKAALRKERAANKRLRRNKTQVKSDKGDEEADRKIQEATRAANGKILKAEIRAAAAKKLHNPEDAVALLNLDDFEVSDDGEVDADEIEEAINDLVKERPYLAADRKGKRKSGNDLGGGDKGKDKPDMNDLLRAAAKGG